MEKLKICWVTQEHTMVGNALGYNTHNKFMRKYSSEYLEFDNDAPIALHIVPADMFNPIPGKFNILFSMWEFLDLPDSYIKNLNKADHIIVPSRFCRDLFKPAVNVPVEVCFEGVEAKSYPYHKRTKNGKFRFLWVGAPNPRKGYPWVVQACKMVEEMADVEIYMKTTMPKMSWKRTIVNAWKKRDLFWKNPMVRKNDKAISYIKRYWNSLVRAIRRIPKPYYAGKLKTWGKHKNIHLDSRFLSFEDLIELYNSANCFILPHCGEGWGLTLCEAMATGCPSIATPTTGCSDFFDETVGFPLDYEIVKSELSDYDLTADGYQPTMDSVIKNMMDVMTNYPEAVRRGKKAHNRINEKFTWERSGKRLAEIIRGIYDANNFTGC